MPNSIKVRKQIPNVLILLLLVKRIFSSYYTSLKLTEFNNDSHYSSARRSLQHGMSEHNKQCGWLRHYARSKAGMFPTFVFLSHFSPTGSCSTGLPNSTTRQNTPICNTPLYIAITFEPSMQFLNPSRFRMA